MEKANTAKPMNEEQMVHLVRNALLVAGQEMGDGDQWPVIKDTIYKIMKDFEEAKIQDNVDAELKVHLYEQIAEMEAALLEFPSELRSKVEPTIKEWREMCDAYFSDVDRNSVYYDAEEAPEHIKRMKAILATMEDKNGK